MSLTKQQIQKQLEYNSIMEFIWHSAKANPNWSMQTAQLIADMHGLDVKKVYSLGKQAKYKSSYKAVDLDISEVKVTQ